MVQEKMSNKAWQRLFEKNKELHEVFGTWVAYKAFVGKYELNSEQIDKNVKYRKKVKLQQLNWRELIQEQIKGLNERINKLEAKKL